MQYLPCFVWRAMNFVPDASCKQKEQTSSCRGFMEPRRAQTGGKVDKTSSIQHCFRYNPSNIIILVTNVVCLIDTHVIGAQAMNF